MTQQDMAAVIAVAKGDRPADLLLTNARIINTFTGSIEEGNVAISSSTIAGIGAYSLAERTIDLHGKYLAPGLIDGHTHVESSLLCVGQYAAAVVPRGTSAVVTDFHEIANVAGLTGAKELLDAADPLPLDFYFMVPSCVPATHLETSGASITGTDIVPALAWKQTIGLGEVMNFPGVLNADPDLLLKLAVSYGKAIDGHAPGLAGKDLQAYISAGIRSDHECVSAPEAAEKLLRGMWIMIREGSSEKNLDALLPLVTDSTYHRCFFVVDDRSCFDLLHDGDIDAIVRKAIHLGLDPVRAIQMATINPAQYFGLRYNGAIAPGYLANLIAFHHLDELDIDTVIYHGQVVAYHGETLFPPEEPVLDHLRHTVHIKPFGLESLGIPVDHAHRPVIQLIPGQIVTRKIAVSPKAQEGLAMPDIDDDILKAVVIERHLASGKIGKGFIKGFALKRGALASSVAHDSHNIVAVGTNDADILVAVREIDRLQGGLVIAVDGQVVDALPLPVAGLLADSPAATVSAKLATLQRVAADLGCPLDAPFATLSFLALPVIPEIRLTDLGLIDVETFRVLG
mgnify:CR=1 FL=1